MRGTIQWLEGNFAGGDGVTEPLEARVVVTEQVEQESTWPSGPDAFWSESDLSVVATGSSDADGAYAIGLEPGDYSVFVEDPDGGQLYCNGFNGDPTGIMQLCPVSISADTWTDADWKVDHQALY